MTGLVRKATLLSVCGLLIAGTAMAFVPSSVTSIYPCSINLVGSNGSRADGFGNFSITVKDVAGNVIPNTAIVVDFTSCCNDIKVAGAQFQSTGNNVPYPLSLDGTKKKVLGTTDASGNITMAIMGFASALRPTPPARGSGVNNGCADIYANGVLLTPNHVQIGTFDEDGGAGGLGMSGADFSVMVTDLLSGTYYQRSDFDYGVTCVQSPLTGADFSKFVTALLLGNSSLNSASTATCP